VDCFYEGENVLVRTVDVLFTPDKRTSLIAASMSALCHKQTFCVAAKALFDQVGAQADRWRAERPFE
jgi:hypothetical protein